MKHITPSNKLLHCCNSILNHLIPFIDETHGKNITENYRDIFLTDFIALERNAAVMQIEYTYIQHIKYAMAALVDEIILHSAWDGSIEWLGQPLQLYFFSEHLAGEGFFTRLDILRQDALNNCNLLEVYYVCLELGFTGIYRIKGREFLQGLQVGLYQQIISARSQQDNNVNSSQLLTKNGEKNYFHELPVSTIGLITIFILVVVYLSFLWSIDRKTDLAVRQIGHNLMV